MLNYGNEVASLVFATPAQTGGSSTSSLLILALPILLIIWLFWTQSRRQKAMRTFSSSLEIGDEVITSAGIYGTIRHLDEQSAWIEVAAGVTLRIDRRAVAMKQPETSAIEPDDTDGPSDRPGPDATSGQ